MSLPLRGRAMRPQAIRRRPLAAAMRRAKLLLPALLLLVAACVSGEDTAAPAPAPPAAGPDPTPAQLVGLDASQLDRLLGPPDFKRSDGPAEIRQYRDAGCVLDVFLYADAAAGKYKVTHVDGRDRTATSGDATPACLAGLLHARRMRTAGS